GCHLTEHLDVERPAAADVLNAPTNLGGATARVGAPQIDVAGLRGSERGAALGARLRHHKRSFAPVAQFHDGAQHFGNDVASLAQHDSVADKHALGLHDILVVQSRLSHDRTGNL